MSGVYKRPSDKARGKAGKWSVWYLDASGKRRWRTAYTDKAASLDLARRLEAEAGQVRDGLVSPRASTLRESARRPAADHVEDYRRGLLARGGTAKHCDRTARLLARLLADAAVASVADLAADRLAEALGRLRAVRSARTANFALAALKAFARWLEANHRVAEAPRSLMHQSPYNEKADRRLVRRALTRPELDRLLAAAEAGPPIEAVRGPRKGPRPPKVFITGPERAALYRLTMGTGFRADELRTLTPERFRLDGPEPTVTVLACYAKNGREAVQPITRELAEALRPFVASRPPGSPVLAVPVRTAKMLRADLAAAGIPHTDAQGRVLDFHALRHSYITHLILSGANPKVVQTLARHSTITLTLDRYTHVDADDVRKALEGGE